MSNEVHAHIFGRSRRGDREEVKMKLYNDDGTEFVPGSTVTGRVYNGEGSPNKPGPLAPIGTDDFTADHRNDPAWWSIHPSAAVDSSVSGGTLNAGSGSGNMRFMLPPPGVGGRATLSLRFTDPTASAELWVCAEQTLQDQKIGGALNLNFLDHTIMLMTSELGGDRNNFSSPLALNHLYTLRVTIDENCVGDISVYDGPPSGSPLYTLPINASTYKQYYHDTPGRVVIKGHYFVADEVIYEIDSAPIPIGQDDDFYIDKLTGDIYGPKSDDTWPLPVNGPGINTRMLDVSQTIDMTKQYPVHHLDCSGKTVVHVRRLLINSATANKDITVYLDNIKPGTPYHVTIENTSPFTHSIVLRTGLSQTSMIVAGNQSKRNALLIAPNEMCSIMSMYTGGLDLPLAVTTQQPRSPRRDVSANYACTEFDLNGLIVVNSANPVTITIRDQGASEWWKGEEIEIYQEGTGAVTIAAPSDTTLLRAGGLTGNFVMPGGRYSTVKLRSMSVQKWALV